MSDTEIVKVPRTACVVSPWNPRLHIDEEKLTQLEDSVREHGILNPLLALVVNDSEGTRYEILAGSRRLAVAGRLGIEEIEVVPRVIDVEKAAAIALLENVDRDDLSLIEEAAHYQRMITELGLSVDDVAALVGKVGKTVSRRIKLLELIDPLRKLVVERRVAARGGELIAVLPEPLQELILAKMDLSEPVTVAECERLVRAITPLKRAREFESGAEAAGEVLVPASEVFEVDGVTFKFDCPYVDLQGVPDAAELTPESVAKPPKWCEILAMVAGQSDGLDLDIVRCVDSRYRCFRLVNREQVVALHHANRLKILRRRVVAAAHGKEISKERRRAVALREREGLLDAIDGVHQGQVAFALFEGLSADGRECFERRWGADCNLLQLPLDRAFRAILELVFLNRLEPHDGELPLVSESPLVRKVASGLGVAV